MRVGFEMCKCSTKVNLYILTNLNVIKKNINNDNLIVIFDLMCPIFVFV